MITTQQTEAKRDRVAAAKMIKQMREKDREMVRGIFKFYEVPHGRMAFSYKAYAEDEVEHFDMNDGEIYTIPRGVAKHLNKNGWYPIHSHVMNEGGTHQVKVGSKVRRFGFQSLDFMDIEDIDPSKSLVTVENVK